MPKAISFVMAASSAGWAEGPACRGVQGLVLRPEIQLGLDGIRLIAASEPAAAYCSYAVLALEGLVRESIGTA